MSHCKSGYGDMTDIQLEKELIGNLRSSLSCKLKEPYLVCLYVVNQALDVVYGD